MNVREHLANNSGAAKAGLTLVVLVFAGVIYLEFKGQRQPVPAAAGKVFCSDDDGRSWFLDDPSLDCPFDHHGKPAYRALVFRCQGRAPFVAYLAKYSDQQKAQIRADAAHGPEMALRWQSRPMQDLKKPGASKWITNRTPSMTGYPDVRCPDGSGNAVPVLPTDPDSGATQ